MKKFYQGLTRGGAKILVESSAGEYGDGVVELGGTLDSVSVPLTDTSVTPMHADLECREVTIQNDSDDDEVRVGTATIQAHRLRPLSSIVLRVRNLNEVYVKALTITGTVKIAATVIK